MEDLLRVQGHRFRGTEFGGMEVNWLERVELSHDDPGMNLDGVTRNRVV